MSGLSESHNPYLELSRLVTRLVRDGAIPPDPPDRVDLLAARVAHFEDLSGMKTEVQYHRNYDTGRYERHTRAVGEWVKDDD